MRLFVFAILFVCPWLAKGQSTIGQQLHALFAKIGEAERSPQDSLYQGVHPTGAWTSSSDAAQRDHARRMTGFAERLKAIKASDLSAQDRISREVMLLKLNDAASQVEHRMHLIPFNAEGGFYNRLAYVLPKLPFATLSDYQAYLAWLPAYTQSLREHTELMRLGVQEGIVAPASVITNMLALLGTWAVEDVQSSPLYEPFGRLPESLSPAERKQLLAQAAQVIGESNRAYRELRTFTAGPYRAASPTLPGVGQLPGGAAFYQNRIAHYTTLDLTVDSVHQLGLREVARIRASMDSIIQSLAFSGSFAEFLAFLRSDEQFYARTPEELLRRAAWISKQAEGQLPGLFERLPSLPFTVAPVPASIAPTYTGGRYVPGSWTQQRPGTYWVNTYDLPSRTLYTLPALSLHEAVPGHHLQGALAAEIDDLPEFRRRYYISAFGEGWGLYSEYLGEEMGSYTTPYELFGRYTYEMWRACRLVIDTGIHGKGWTRQRALDYLASNTALSLHEVRTEIDRYIGWPGQAVSYKVGELHIKALRRQAEAELGEDFDVRKFHTALLQNGSVPLPLLSEQVEAYIAETKS